MLVTSALSARKSGEIVDLADEAQSEEAPKKKKKGGCCRGKSDVVEMGPVA